MKHKILMLSGKWDLSKNHYAWMNEIMPKEELVKGNIPEEKIVQTGIKKTFHQRCTTTILSFPTWDQLEQTDLPIQGLHTNIRKNSTNEKNASFLFWVCRTWTSNLRDFLTPTAWFEERAADFTIISKYQVKTYQKLWIHWQSGLVIISIINWYMAT